VENEREEGNTTVRRKERSTGERGSSYSHQMERVTEEENWTMKIQIQITPLFTIQTPVPYLRANGEGGLLLQNDSYIKYLKKEVYT